MMNKMIVANLTHRPLRSLISILAIALEVTLILLIVGLSMGMLNDSRKRQEGIGADVVVAPPGSSAMVGITGAPAPIKVADIIAKLPHVVSVAPVLMQLSTAGNVELVYGIDLKSYDSITGGISLSGRRAVSGAGRCTGRRHLCTIQPRKGWRQDRTVESFIPGSRSRRARNGCPQVRPARYHAGTKWIAREGLVFLRQAG